MTKQKQKTKNNKQNKKQAPTKSKKKKEMTQRVKVPAAKPDHQSLIPGTQVLVRLCPLQIAL